MSGYTRREFVENYIPALTAALLVACSKQPSEYDIIFNPHKMQFQTRQGNEYIAIGVKSLPSWLVELQSNQRAKAWRRALPDSLIVEVHGGAVSMVEGGPFIGRSTQEVEPRPTLSLDESNLPINLGLTPNTTRGFLTVIRAIDSSSRVREEWVGYRTKGIPIPQGGNLADLNTVYLPVLVGGERYMQVDIAQDGATRARILRARWDI